MNEHIVTPHESTSRPVIIEAAINGARSKAFNPHVPLSSDEIVNCISACVEALTVTGPPSAATPEASISSNVSAGIPELTSGSVA